MTKDDINRRISELREPVPVFQFGNEQPPNTQDELSNGGSWHWYKRDGTHIAKDWHLDANWPTLLREMLGEIQRSVGGFAEWCCRPNSKPGNKYDWIYSKDLEQAVCLAWLQWKDPQVSVKKL